MESALYSAYGTRQVSNIFTPTNDYEVIMELLPQFQRDPVALHLLYVRSNTGKLVPLESVVKPRNSVGALTVAHYGQSPAVSFSFNMAPGVSLGDVTERIEEAARETLPATIRTAFQGTAAAFQSSFAGMGMLLVMAILVIYMVLGILYESFIHPLTILSGLPSAGLGALITLLVFKNELNIFSFVGIIMLIGIVKKNAIMMIDFAVEAQRTHGHVSRRSDHRSLLGALPADHDDHHGGPGGHVADRARARRGRRSPAAAGFGGGWRAGGLAAPDAIYHAGDLHLHGALHSIRPQGRTHEERSGGGRAAARAALKTVLEDSLADQFRAVSSERSMAIRTNWLRVRTPVFSNRFCRVALTELLRRADPVSDFLIGQTFEDAPQNLLLALRQRPLFCARLRLRGVRSQLEPIFGSIHSPPSATVRIACRSVAGRTVLQEDSRNAEFLRDRDIQRAHSGRHHENLTRISARRSRRNETCAGLFFQIEIQQDDIDRGAGEHFESFR